MLGRTVMTMLSSSPPPLFLQHECVDESADSRTKSTPRQPGTFLSCLLLVTGFSIDLCCTLGGCDTSRCRRWAVTHRGSCRTAATLCLVSTSREAGLTGTAVLRSLCYLPVMHASS